MHSECNNINREFGFCNIVWKIEHFCLATCKKDWVISSPEFSLRAVFFTRWKIILKPTPHKSRTDDCMVTASLKRVDNNAGPDVVRANWKFSFLNRNNNEYNFTDTEYYFKKDSYYHEDLECMSKIMSEFKSFESDVLYFQCQMIVSFDNPAKFSVDGEQGIKELSNDLSMLYSSEKAHDVTLKVRDKHILAHKAILYARSPSFASIFDSKHEIQLIDLFPPDSSGTDLLHGKFMDIDAVEKVLAYLYSGNLQSVISKPTISIYECAQFFDVSEVIQCYSPDEMNMQFSIDAEEIVIFWIIKDIESINEDCIVSPPLTGTSSETTWRLLLRTKRQEDSEEDVSIYAEAIEGIQSQDICFEVATMNANREFLNYRRMQTSVGFCELLAYPNFNNEKWLKKSSVLENGNLRIVSKLSTFNDFLPPSCSIECSSVSAEEKITKDTFELLSEDMRILFEEGKFSDAKIYCENKVFNVHKCILAIRSDSLSKNLWAKLKDTDKAEVSDITSEMFNILLSFIYSGTIADFNHDVMFDVYKAAERFNMYGLMNKSLQIYNSNNYG